MSYLFTAVPFCIRTLKNNKHNQIKKSDQALGLAFIIMMSLLFSLISVAHPSHSNLNVHEETRGVMVPPQFVLIQAGSFLMGSPENESYRFGLAETQHPITLTHDFEMQITEVTQMQWVSVMGYNPSQFHNKDWCPEDYTEVNGIAMCPNHPVEMISWNDAKSFLQQLNSKTQDGYTYRLPTEAEWEYAARGGQSTAYSFGSNLGDLYQYGWFDANSTNSAHRVASKYSNSYGLYDMHGNIYEFVQDWWTQAYPSDLQVDPQGPWGGTTRVIRGGSWYSISHVARSAARNHVHPDEQRPYLGFRMVRVLSSTSH